MYKTVWVLNGRLQPVDRWRGTFGCWRPRNSVGRGVTPGRIRER